VTITLDEVRSAFGEISQLSAGEVALPIWDANELKGVGVDSSGRVVLVLRPCELSTNVDSDHFEFKARCSLSIRGQKFVEAASVLYIDRPNLVNFDVDAVATVFLGLIEVSVDKHVVLSEVIEGLSELFENGYLDPMSFNDQVGLIGELLVIFQANDVDYAIECWRSGDRDKFDFSSHSERVEVKTTTKNQRIHNFSDTQIPGPADCAIVVVSVQLILVELGTTLRDLVTLVWNSLDTTIARSDLIRKAGVVYGSSSNETELIHFDIEGSIRSIHFVNSADVPRPSKRPGVLTMSWSALLDCESDLPAGKRLIPALCPSHG
jgi:hypothetical protein